MDKCPSVSRSESPLAGICLSESEKAAVLTLIREEVTAPGYPALAPGLPLPALLGRGDLIPCLGQRGNPSEQHIPRVPCLLQPR